MTGPDILNNPVRVDLRGERLYFNVPGEVCVDVCSGLPEDRARVLALLAQVQRMAALLHVKVTDAVGCEEPGWTREAEKMLRDAGVMSGGSLDSEER